MLMMMMMMVGQIEAKDGIERGVKKGSTHTPNQNEEKCRVDFRNRESMQTRPNREMAGVNSREDAPEPVDLGVVPVYLRDN